MNDKGFNLSPERRAALRGGFGRLIADRAKAEAKHLYEARYALRVSIPGAIEGAGDLDKLGSEQLRVVAQEVAKLLGYINEQLKGVNDEQ